MSFEEYFSALVELFGPLYRKGPGCDAVTREVLTSLELASDADVIDLGCGTGAASFILAGHFSSVVYALDLSTDFINQLNRKAEERGVANLKGIVGNMDAPSFPDGSFDLIWCECSIYVTGFSAALDSWRNLLKPGGLIVASDVVWKTGTPTPACHEFWNTEYPDMTTVRAREEQADGLNYQVEQVYELPRECWWEEYYQPLERRMDELEEKGNLRPALEDAIASTRKEVATFKQYGDEIGSAFFVMRRRG